MVVRVDGWIPVEGKFALDRANETEPVCDRLFKNLPTTYLGEGGVLSLSYRSVQGLAHEWGAMESQFIILEAWHQTSVRTYLG